MDYVAPRVGAWIETRMYIQSLGDTKSHPVWVRGLKHRCKLLCFAAQIVAPRVGAWIETVDRESKLTPSIGRTPCGCVD